MESPHDIPEANHLDYAPPPVKRRVPWLVVICAPVLGAAAFCTTMGIVMDSNKVTDRAMFMACGSGFAVCGGIWFWIGALRSKGSS